MISQEAPPSSSSTTHIRYMQSLANACMQSPAPACMHASQLSIDKVGLSICACAQDRSYAQSTHFHFQASGIFSKIPGHSRHFRT